MTGAGSGIGKAIATALLGEGYRVVLSGRRREPLEALAADNPPEATLVVPADVGDPDSVEGLFRQVDERFGRLDLLVNNAGATAPAVPIDELDIARWNALVAANLTGVFLCTRAAFRIMKAQDPRGGRIINNGSVSAHAPRPLTAAYTATKHGVTGLTKATALDGRAHDIACGQIDIGNAATAATERMEAGILQASGATAPEPRMDVAHVARSVVHMASLPLDANVLFMTVMATKMPFIGRG